VHRYFFTADDIYQLIYQQNSSVLLLGPDDIITAEAEDLANRLGLRVIRQMETQSPFPKQIHPDFDTPPSQFPPPLKVVRGSQVVLEKFGYNTSEHDANTLLKDVIISADRSPMSAGYMAIDKGSFSWTLSYDEIDIILEGELEIRRGSDEVSGGVGDVIYIPKGSSVVFSTPGKARFVYVTYPANWQEK
jgi:ethanolamine utilization protein EutQ (cupin superfamily)